MISASIIPIIFSTDHNFVMPTGVALTSLISTSKDESYEINILVADDVNDVDKHELSSIVENSRSKIRFISIGDIFDHAYEVRGISKATYFRLLIPWLFPEYDKVIYCDGDVIFRGGLKELYDINLDNCYIGGVKDYFNAKNFKKHLHEIGLDWEKYINAGVLLINSKKQRADNLQSKYQSHFNKKYEYQDQDILNIVCKDKIKYISFIYNFNPDKYKIFANVKPNLTQRYPDFNSLDDLKRIKIIHYCGNKPWNCRSGFLAYDWWSYYSRSKWHNPNLEYKFNFNMMYPTLNPRKILSIIVNNILSRGK